MRTRLHTIQQESRQAKADPARTVQVYRNDLRLSQPVAAYMGAHIARPVTPVDETEKARFSQVAAWFAGHKVVPRTVDLPSHVVDVTTVGSG